MSNSITEILERQNSPKHDASVPTTGYDEIDDESTLSSIGGLDLEIASSSSDDITTDSDITPHANISPHEDKHQVHITIQSPPSPRYERPPNAVHLNESIQVLNKDNTYDDISEKLSHNFRFTLQNTRGIKEFKDKDPKYVPTMTALKEAGADMLCFVETNTPWHKNDMIYDISTVNKIIWDTPTKTVGASCRTEGKSSTSYLPGGSLSIIANSLTTKIQSTTTDKLGRWTKVRFFNKRRRFGSLHCLQAQPILSVTSWS